jgi:Leucine-rich repeat (LRR) protein
LNLDQNQLTSFDPTNQLPKLQYLSLNNNKISKLPQKLDLMTPNLKSISLSSNNFSTIEAFPILPQLDTVYLQSNKLTEIPKNAFSNLKNIKNLYLNRNHLTKFETDLNFPNLTNLALGYNKISNIPKNFLSTTPNLQYLNMDSNQLTTLEVFSNLTELESLSVNYNNISSIQPDFFAKHPKLRAIGLYGNRCINAYLSTSGTLTLEEVAKSHLFFCYTGTTPVPTTRPSVPTTRPSVTTTRPPATTTTTTTVNPNLPVQTCRFSNHRDRGYTCTLSRISYLSDSDDFTITGNHLAGKTDEQVHSVVFLRSTLGKVPKNIFLKFKNLKSLDIAGTGLTKADEYTFEACGKLKDLDASDNDISVVKEGFLASCTHLENVMIENNLISKISPWNVLIKGLKHLKSLSLLYNVCVDETFTKTNFSEIYEKTNSKPMKSCFKNFINGQI